MKGTLPFIFPPFMFGRRPPSRSGSCRDLSGQVEEQHFRLFVGLNRQRLLIAHGGSVARLEAVAVQAHAPLHDLEPRVTPRREVVPDLVARAEQRVVDGHVLVERDRPFGPLRRGDETQLPSPLLFRESLLLVVRPEPFALWAYPDL